MKEINYIHTEQYHNTKSPEIILPFVLNLLQPGSILDVGCGTGTWLKVAKKLGVKSVTGVDGIHVDKKMLGIQENEFVLHNLTLPLELKSKFDLVICLEVAEHLPENAADNLIQSLISHSDIVLFSAGVPGQGGQAHINEQWPQYWQTKFHRHGFLVYDILREVFWEESNAQWWYKQNMFVYARLNHPSLEKYKPVEHIRNLVHPDLLLEIDQERNGLKDLIGKPKFMFSIKLLLKSIFNYRS